MAEIARLPQHGAWSRRREAWLERKLPLAQRRRPLVVSLGFTAADIASRRAMAVADIWLSTLHRRGSAPMVDTSGQQGRVDIRSS
jgi:hypothetical protein